VEPDQSRPGFETRQYNARANGQPKCHHQPRPIHVRRGASLPESQQAAHRAARGIHTSALAQGSRLLCTAHDVGRHNTVDKITGYCLQHGLPMRDRILLTSGRVSSEMLNKAARMGVPVVISHTSPTSLSVELARAWDITFIGYARGRNFRLYAGAHRLTGNGLRRNPPLPPPGNGFSLGNEVVEKLGIHGSRAHQKHADPLAMQLRAQGLTPAAQREFARHVLVVVGNPLMPQDGTDKNHLGDPYSSPGESRPGGKKQPARSRGRP
jgi:hypothetical protein